MAVKVPPILLNPDLLSEDIFVSWHQLMVTDRVDGIENWPNWKGLPQEWRSTLGEAVKMAVCQQLQKLVNDLHVEQFDREIEETFTVSKPQGRTRPCYVCWEEIAGKAGSLCLNCRRIYRHE